jgi:hypothetical protein
MNALGGIGITMETVTPATAREYLKFNAAGQRRATPNRIKRYADDMRSGRWRLTHQGIAFSDKGEMIDGQNRCLASIEAGASFDTLVFRNVPADTFTFLDQGKARTASDALRFLGQTNVNDVRAVASTLLAYRDHPGAVWGGMALHTQNEVVEFSMAVYDVLTEAAGETRSVKGAGVKVHPSAFGAFVALAAGSGYDEDLQDFLESLRTGARLEPGDPVLTLRNLEARRLGSASQWQKQQRLAVYIKTFNAYVEGRTVRQLGFRRDELPMPVIRGVGIPAVSTTNTGSNA